MGLQAFDPGTPVDPAPGYRNPDTKKKRDKRTPFLPSNLAKRGKCPPYQRVTDVMPEELGARIYSGLIPLVREEVLEDAPCYTRVRCEYRGRIAFLFDFETGAKRYATRAFGAGIVMTIPKEGPCCGESE
jgi:hypothetical protein